jgi:hypothetical protein
LITNPTIAIIAAIINAIIIVVAIINAIINVELGRCAIGVLMSYFGWDGRDDSRASRKFLSVSNALSRAGFNKDLVVQLNDAGKSFDGIADYLDQLHELTPNDLIEC